MQRSQQLQSLFSQNYGSAAFYKGNERGATITIKVKNQSSFNAGGIPIAKKVQSLLSTSSQY